MSAAAEDNVIRYGNLREPKMPGFGRLTFGASVFLVMAAVVLMLLSLIHVGLAAAWAVFAVLAAAPTAFPTKDGYGRYELFWRGRRARAARKGQRSTLRQGLVGAVPDGECRLPGVAARTGLTSETDMHGRPFGLIHWAHADLYAVVLQTAPAGFAGLDKDVVDNHVAHYAGWLSQLNTVESIVGASAVIETVPDSGQRLARAMQRGRVDDTQIPEFARLVEAEIRDNFRVGSPTLTCRITLTLSARVDDAEHTTVHTRQEMAEQIGDLLPAWVNALAPTGAGTNVRACTAQEITDFTRVAFDPSVAEDVEEAQLAAAAGQGDGTGLTWAEAGPLFHDNLADTYVHESTLSRTWQMKHPPRGVFFAETLQRILEPHKDIARKRVTLLYRPETPEASANAADADVRKAIFKSTQGRRSKATADVELEAARHTARQEAQGSPLIRVGMLLTVSAYSEESLRKASRAVKTSLAAQARIGVRVPRGSQDMAFLTALPLGLVPHQMTRAPKKNKKGSTQSSHEEAS